MKGPNPVCTSARKKMNQSRPRRLWREGGAGGFCPSGSDRREDRLSLFIGRSRSPSTRDERTNSMVRCHQGSNCNGFRLPDAPSTTIGMSSLYSGAAVTWSFVSSSMMTSLLSATRPKCKAFHSPTILRLPTPRKPPKSMTAARPNPLRSTMTSTMRPISSLAALRTSRPSTPCASLAPMMVTEGGGDGSFGAAGGAVACGGDGCCELWSVGGTLGLSSARDETAAKAAHAIAMKMNRTLARMRPPEVLDPKGHQVRKRIGCCMAIGSVRVHDRHLNLAARPQYLQ